MINLEVALPEWLRARLSEAALFGGMDQALTDEEMVVAALIYFLGNAEPNKTKEQRCARNREIAALRERFNGLPR